MEIVLSTSDLPNVCRACLSYQPEVGLHSLANDSVRELYQSCTMIESSSTDGLPQNICMYCLERCDSWLKFKESCGRAEEILAQLVDGPHPSVIKASVVAVAEDGNESCYIIDKVELIEGPDEAGEEVNEEIIIEESMENSLADNSLEEDSEVLADSSIILEGCESDIVSQSGAANQSRPLSRKRNILAVPKQGIESPQIKCQVCSEIFTEIGPFESHTTRDHLSIENMICLECTTSFTSPFFFKDHMYLHSDFVFPCENCNRALPRRRLYVQHISRCLKSGKTASKLVSANKIKAKNRRSKVDPVPKDRTRPSFIKCQVCNESFSDPNAFEMHASRIHLKWKEMRCSDCPEKFTSPILYRDHMYQHSDFIFPCPNCTKRFARRRPLMKHINQCRDCVCDVCGREFQSMDSLRAHMVSHSNDKPFACSHCNLRFKNKGALNNHERRHGEKSYPCEMCNKTFFWLSEVRAHMKFEHCHYRPHVCMVCSRSFRLASNLRDHVRIHTGERPFACEHCGQKFVSERTLKEHRYKHNGETPYQCDICKHACRSRDMLRAHRRTHK